MSGKLYITFLFLVSSFTVDAQCLNKEVLDHTHRLLDLHHSSKVRSIVDSINHCTQDPSEKAILYVLKAQSFLQRNENGSFATDSAHHWLARAEESDPDPSTKNEIILTRVDAFLLMDQFVDAMKVMESSELNSPSLLSRKLELYLAIGDIDQADEIFKQIQKKTGYNDDILLSMGKYLIRIESYHRAEETLSIVVDNQSGRISPQIEALHLLAEIAKSQGNHERAQAYYDEAIDREELAGHVNGLLRTLLVASESALMGGLNPEVVDPLIRKALHYASKEKNVFRLAQALLIKGYGLQQHGLRDSAITCLDSARILSDRLNAWYWARAAARLLAANYEEMGKPQKALVQLKNVLRYGDSLDSQKRNETSELLQNIHTMYRYKEEKELTQHRLKEEQLARRIWVAIAGGGALLVILLLIMYLRQRNHNKFLTEQALKSAANELPDTPLPRVDDSERERINKNLKEKFDQFILDEGFTNPKCTLGSLAKYLETNTSYLSRFINDHKGDTFNNVINTYRVKHFIRRIKDDRSLLKQYTIEHLASESGFKSKSTFSRAFKKETGLTPTTFIKNL